MRRGCGMNEALRGVQMSFCSKVMIRRDNDNDDRDEDRNDELIIIGREA